jgi:hypothetical protein
MKLPNGTGQLGTMQVVVVNKIDAFDGSATGIGKKAYGSSYEEAS